MNDIGFLLECLAGLVLVHRGSDLAGGVRRPVPGRSTPAAGLPAGGQCIWDEHVERAGPGAGRVAVLLGEGADHRCWPAVVRTGQRGLRCREGVPTQRLVPWWNFFAYLDSGSGGQG